MVDVLWASWAVATMDFMYRVTKNTFTDSSQREAFCMEVSWRADIRVTVSSIKGAYVWLYFSVCTDIVGDHTA